LISNFESEVEIGTCGFFNFGYKDKTAEIGITLKNQSLWSKGIGAEALSLLIDYGFKKLKLHNIMIKIYDFENEYIKYFKGIGFKTIGKRRETLIINKKKYNLILMDLLKNEFKPFFSFP